MTKNLTEQRIASLQTAEAIEQEKQWWRRAVLYQIYPLSYKSTTNKQTGDLQGIIEKLPYLSNLGIDAIWIAPFLESPFKDFGYDVSNYRKVSPTFGTNADFTALLEQAHTKGIRVLIDMVVSHTSNKHAWFQESSQDRTNAKANWYVWADPQADGTPPNNWLSIFGGSAWQWSPIRKQYYFHNFTTEQPDLNYHNIEVRQQILNECDFWLKQGVDGFRLDTSNYYFHDILLRNNPAAKPISDVSDFSMALDNPYSMQEAIYSKSRPECLTFLKELRTLADTYPGTVLLGEVGDTAEVSLQLIPAYTKENEGLHMCYSFDLLGENFTPTFFASILSNYDKHLDSGWLCIAFSNHDVPRYISRWHKDNIPNFSAFAISLLGSLRGSICLYQGEELGLTEANLAYEDLVDPYGLAFYPTYKGRDGCRTPMPWDNTQEQAGFSQGKPWLPIPKEHMAKAVNTQLADPTSSFTQYKQFLTFRKQRTTLQTGDFTLIKANETLLVFERKSKQETILCIFNFSALQADYRLPYKSKNLLYTVGKVVDEGKQIVLDGYSSAFIAI